MWKSRNAYRILVEKSDERRSLGRPRRKGVGNIKIDLREDGFVRSGSIWLRIITGVRLLLTG
jgi:hypothetical protein